MKFFGRELTFNGFKVFTEDSLRSLSQLTNDIFDFKAKSIELEESTVGVNVQDAIDNLKASIDSIISNSLPKEHILLKSPNGTVFKLEMLDDGAINTIEDEYDESAVESITMKSQNGYLYNMTIHDDGSIVSVRNSEVIRHLTDFEILHAKTNEKYSEVQYE